MASPKILIVEDEMIAAASLEIDLKKMGYEVLGIANSGEKAIELAIAHKPNVILMDIVIRGSHDGIETAKRIKEVHDSPIIYLTSFSNLETLDRAKRTQPQGYIVKPYRKLDVQAAIQAVFASSEQQGLRQVIKKNRRRAKIGAFKAKSVLDSLPTSQKNNLDTYRKRFNYIKRLPQLSDSDQEIIHSLEATGVYQTDIHSLQLQNSQSFCKSIEALIPELYTRSKGEDWSVRCPWERKILYPEILFGGLQKRLLDIAEVYIGLPLLFQGYDLRRDAKSSQIVGPQQWHRDIDDFRMVKFLIYLNDVNAGGGPFEYISRPFTSEISQALNYVSGYISDDDISLIAPHQHWQQAYGKKWTILIVDPCSIFHRAQPATTQDRLSITFGFTSRQPQVDLCEFSLSFNEWERFASRLSPRLKACLRRR